MTASESQLLTKNGVTGSLAITSDWGSGYCASVTLSNGGSTAVTSWQVVMNSGALDNLGALEGTLHRSGNDRSP